MKRKSYGAYQKRLAQRSEPFTKSKLNVRFKIVQNGFVFSADYRGPLSYEEEEDIRLQHTELPAALVSTDGAPNWLFRAL